MRNGNIRRCLNEQRSGCLTGNNDAARTRGRKKPSVVSIPEVSDRISKTGSIFEYNSSQKDDFFHETSASYRHHSHFRPSPFCRRSSVRAVRHSNKNTGEVEARCTVKVTPYPALK
jgi:hypothetical protein